MDRGNYDTLETIKTFISLMDSIENILILFGIIFLHFINEKPYVQENPCSGIAFQNGVIFLGQILKLGFFFQIPGLANCCV